LLGLGVVKCVENVLWQGKKLFREGRLSVLSRDVLLRRATTTRSRVRTGVEGMPRELSM
jgi:hypothetical protein